MLCVGTCVRTHCAMLLVLCIHFHLQASSALCLWASWLAGWQVAAAPRLVSWLAGGAAGGVWEGRGCVACAAMHAVQHRSASELVVASRFASLCAVVLSSSTDLRDGACCAHVASWGCDRIWTSDALIGYVGCRVGVRGPPTLFAHV